MRFGLLFIFFTIDCFAVVGGQVVKEETPVFMIKSFHRETHWGTNSQVIIDSRGRQGTAFAISDSVLVTSTHTLEEQISKEFNILTLTDNKGKTLELFSSDYEIFYSDEYGAGSCHEDIAFVKFTRPIFKKMYSIAESNLNMGEQVSFMGFGVSSIKFDSFDRSKIIKSSYPSKKILGYSIGKRYLLRGTNKVHELIDSEYFFTIQSYKDSPSYEDAYAAGGDSGAPVFNSKGEVVGLVCRLYDKKSQHKIFNEIINIHKTEIYLKYREQF